MGDWRGVQGKAVNEQETCSGNLAPLVNDRAEIQTQAQVLRTSP